MKWYWLNDTVCASSREGQLLVEVGIDELGHRSDLARAQPAADRELGKGGVGMPAQHLDGELAGEGVDVALTAQSAVLRFVSDQHRSAVQVRIGGLQHVAKLDTRHVPFVDVGADLRGRSPVR